VRRRYRLRQVANAINLSTPIGLALATLGDATLSPWPNGLIIASEHRLPFPSAPAFTMGNVVLVRARRAQLDEFDAEFPELMRHEERHTTQFAFCLGPVMVPLYLGACAWSWARTGDWWSRNLFETRAGLIDGGYLANPTRRQRRRQFFQPVEG